MTPDDGLAEAALRKKAERERRARLEAEAIAEKATLDLYQAAERQRAILMSAGDGILAADRDGNVEVVNRAALDLLGRPESAVRGRPLHAVIHGATRGPHCPGDGCGFEAILGSSKDVRDGETQAQRSDGVAFPANYTFTPMIQQQNHVGSVLTLRDATLRKQAEEARLQMLSQMDEVRRLQDVDKFKTNFINMAAHELRTPLTPIRTELFLMKQAIDELPELHKKSVVILDRTFTRLARLIEDVLEGARLQAGKLGVSRAAIDLSAIVNESIDAFSSTMDQRGIRLERRLAPAMPMAGDAGRLTQVVMNFLSNAVKFTPKGGSITVEGRAGTDTVSVAVRDTGKGLAKDEVPALFKPFSQVVGHQEAAHDGAGLGLYICKGIVELHGGRIWAESPGRGLGSTFRFEIPREDAVSPAVGEGRSTDA